MHLKSIIFTIIIFTNINQQVSGTNQGNNRGEKISVYDLIVEYKNNPIGIDVEKARMSWKINSTEKNVLQTAYQIQVATSTNDLKLGKNLLWDSKVQNFSQSTHVYYQGNKLNSGERVYWRVKIWCGKQESKWSLGNDFWELGLLSTNDWTASWITDNVVGDLYQAKPIPLFRKEFNISKKIVSARVYVTSLGIYELRINGSKVSDALFTPGWTSYNKRLQYQTYDITDVLKNGQNAVGVTVADGWYRGHLAGWAKPNRNHYGEKLAFLMQMLIRYENGTTDTIITDSSWKSSTGPIRYADFYNGESYDANFEKKGWDSHSFNDNDWKHADILDHSKQMLIAQIGPPVKRQFEISPQKIYISPNGETIVDMGQNMVGWIQMKIKGTTGKTVVLKHAEITDSLGNMYFANLKGALQQIKYTFKNEDEVIFEPHFTFQGFRFFSISGLEYIPQLSDFKGEIIYSSIEKTGDFSCSDPLINKLQENIQWGQRGNFVDVPTDCPQRSERLGWTGDAQVFAPTAAFNMNVASFFTKWLGDVAVDQKSNGQVGHIIPYLDVLGEGGGYGSAAWADVAVVIPWTMYQYYGDSHILDVQYKSMKAWVDFMKNSAGNTFLHTKGFHYGDWLAFATENSDYPGATTDKDIISSAYFAYSTSLLIKAANVLGKSADVEYYTNILDQIKIAFDREFISTNGRVGSNTQTSYALALAFNLVPKEKEKSAAERLAIDVRKFGHLTTGFVGTPLLCNILTKYGYNDEAFMLLTRKEYPSWLYPVTKGATTIWERWDGIKPNGEINTKSAFTNDSDEDIMNSFNHYAYGAIGDWMYKTIAGINFDESEPGFKKIQIKPLIGGNLTNATASFKSMYGTIVSSWKILSGKVILDVEIPANTTATVLAPDIIGNYTVYQIGSGKYRFVH